MKFVDVKNDIAFRKIFGNDNKKEALISFLNAVLNFEPMYKITDVTILNPYQLPNLSGGKVSIVDIRAKDAKNRQFIVEMQITEKEGFDKRVLYYISKNYASQIKDADQYRQLMPAYFIGILGKFSHTNNPNYISRNKILDIDTGEVTIKDIEFTFLELEKFNKKQEELMTLIDKWIFFIKNSQNLEVIPNNVNDEGLLLAYQEAQKYLWDTDELEAYDYVKMREEDFRAERDAYVKKTLTAELLKMQEKMSQEIIKAKETQELQMQELIEQQQLKAQELIEKEQLKAQELIEKEQLKAQELIEKEQLKAQELIEKEQLKAQELIEKEQLKAQELIEKEQLKAQELIEKEQLKAQELIEKEQLKVQEQTKQMAKSMLIKGFDLLLIAEITKLSVEEIKEMQ